jgi:hypothetical protein
MAGNGDSWRNMGAVSADGVAISHIWHKAQGSVSAGRRAVRRAAGVSDAT